MKNAVFCLLLVRQKAAFFVIFIDHKIDEGDEDVQNVDGKGSCWYLECTGTADEDIYERLNALLQGQSLLVAGYLKVVKTAPSFSGDYMCEVALPNREIVYAYNKGIIQMVWTD